MKKLTVIFLIILTNCGSLSENDKKQFHNIYSYRNSHYYEVLPLYNNREFSLSYYSPESRVPSDSLYAVLQNLETKNIVYSVSEIVPFICIDTNYNSGDTISLPLNRKDNIIQNGYKFLFFPKAKELHYKELLVEVDSLPVSKNDSLLYQDMYGDNPKRLEQVLKETKIPKKTVYASIEMPEETLKIKYVQGMHPAFFGTDSLYQKGVLFFYTGAPLPSFEETLQPYSGLYVIRPKED